MLAGCSLEEAPRTSPTLVAKVEYPNYFADILCLTFAWCDTSPDLPK